MRIKVFLECIYYQSLHAKFSCFEIFSVKINGPNDITLLCAISVWGAFRRMTSVKPAPNYLTTKGLLPAALEQTRRKTSGHDLLANWDFRRVSSALLEVLYRLPDMSILGSRAPSQYAKVQDSPPHQLPEAVIRAYHRLVPPAGPFGRALHLC